jgi:hypothetical protein
MLKSLEFLALFCQTEARVACARAAVRTRPYLPFVTVGLNPLAFSVWVRFANRRSAATTRRCAAPRMPATRLRLSLQCWWVACFMLAPRRPVQAAKHKMRCRVQAEKKPLRLSLFAAVGRERRLQSARKPAPQITPATAR